MKRKWKRSLSLALAAAMLVTSVPCQNVYATEQDNLKEKLRQSISDEEFPNGLFGFAETQLTVNEGEKTTISVVRQGNTDTEASVKFKAVDVTAANGKDYQLIVKHSAFKTERPEGTDEGKTMLEKNDVSDASDLQQDQIMTIEEPVVSGNSTVSGDAVEVTVDDTLTTEQAEGDEPTETEPTVEAQETEEDGDADNEDKKLPTGVKGLQAAYELQSDAEIPSNDWKEMNPENAPKEITDAMDQGDTSIRDAIADVDGVSCELVFKPGEYKKDIIVETLDDDKAESEEQMAFFLYDAQGTPIGDYYNGYVNIVDNEEAQEMVYGVAAKEVAVQAEEDTARVTIVRTSGIDQIGFVTVGTKGNSAVAGTDYETVTRDLVFPAGVTEKTVEVPIIGDRDEEKSFWVGISENGTVVESDNAATLVTILPRNVQSDGNEIVDEDALSAETASAGEKNIPVTNKKWITSGAYVTGEHDFRLANKIVVEYEVDGETSKKECKKTNYYYQKRAYVNLSWKNGSNTEQNQQEFASQKTQKGTTTFSRNMNDKKQFTKWDNLSKGRIWVSASGFGENSNAKIRVTKITAYYPGINFSINNGTGYSKYTTKTVKGVDDKNNLIVQNGKTMNLGNAYFGNDNTNTKKTLYYAEDKLNLNFTFSNEKTAFNVPASGSTVVFKGYRLSKPNTTNQYSEIVDSSLLTKMEKTGFMNKYKDYLYNGLTFELVPVFEVKDAKVIFDNASPTKGGYKGYTNGGTITVKKLDDIEVNAASNKGYAVSSIQMRGEQVIYYGRSFVQYNVTNAGTDASKLKCGLGNNSANQYKVSLLYDVAKLKVMFDPADKNNADAKNGVVIYADENNTVYTAGLKKGGGFVNDFTISNIVLNNTYNIIGVPKVGYTPAWRDGTLDYNEDGEIVKSELSSQYTSFTPVEGGVLPYTAKVPTGRVYFAFRKQNNVTGAKDIYGNVYIHDKMLLTGRKLETPLNGATVNVDGADVQTVDDGYFRIKKKTLDPHCYYLVNVNSNGEEGSINTSFVMNPGLHTYCIIDTEDDLTIENTKIYVKDKKTNVYNEKAVKADNEGYYSDLANGNADYRISMKADKANVQMKSAVLSFYDIDGKPLSKSVNGVAVNPKVNDGRFNFDFNPETLSLPAGTTCRVSFTDNLDHTYLSREVGLRLVQSVGVLDIANSFSFGGANTAIKIVGKIDSALNMGWNGDFDDSEYVHSDENGDKIIAFGIDSKEILNKKDETNTIQSAAKKLASKEEDIAKANTELMELNKKLSKKKNLTESDKKNVEAAMKKVEDSYAARDAEKLKYDETVGKAQNPQKMKASLATNVNLNVGFSLAVTFGRENSQYYFKSMVLSGNIEGGGGVNVSFATPIGVSINLGFAAGGKGVATFVIEERQNATKKYFIKDIQSGEGSSIDLFDCDMKDLDRKFDGYGNFNVEPYIKISVGAGVLGNMISVEVDGTATFVMAFYTTAQSNTGYVNLNATIGITVLMIHHEWSLGSTNIDLFGNSGASSLLEGDNYLYESADVLEPTDIGYMQGGTKWKSGGISAKSIDESEDAYKELSIADKIAENPDFKMITIGQNKYLAVFTNVAAGREAVNAKAIYYTVYSGDTWSTPVMIEDDGTLDQYPNVFDLGEKGAFITWSSANKEFTTSTSRVDMQNALDLHGVFFDKTSMSIGEIQNITKTTTDDGAGKDIADYSDFASDVAANVSYNEDGMVVYYQKKEYAASAEGEVLGDVLFPQYSVMSARTYDFTKKAWVDEYPAAELEAVKQEFIADGCTEAEAEERAQAYNKCFYGQRFFDFLPAVRVEETLDDSGYWTAEPSVKEIDSNAALVVDTDAISYNDLGVFAYTIDLDGDLKTVNDRDVYMQIYDFKQDAFLHPVVITSDDVCDQSIQFARVKKGDHNGIYLTWLKDGNIVALDMGNIVGNYKTLLKTGTTQKGATYYYLDKTAPADPEATAYIPPMKLVEGEVADVDGAISAISDFDVETSDSYVYFMWTQMETSLKDGVEEGSYEANDPANCLTEEQMYVARYDLASGEMTKPVQVTSSKGANYKHVAFQVEGEDLVGLVYKADSRTLSMDEYNEIIKKNNESAASGNGNAVSANEVMDTVNEASYVPISVVDVENAAPYAFRLDPKSVVKVKDVSLDNVVAGQTATLNFTVLNDGIDNIAGYSLTAKNEKGESVLYGNKEEGENGEVMTTSEIVDNVTIDTLKGGDQMEAVCMMDLAEDAKETAITITISDQDGNVVATEKISEQMESSLVVSEVSAEVTEKRNVYEVTGTIANLGTTASEATKVQIGVSKNDADRVYTSVDVPALLVDETYEFTQQVTVVPNNDFTQIVDTDGNVTETGILYAQVGEERAETEIVRSAKADAYTSVKAIKDLTVKEASKDIVSLKQGDKMLLNPKVTMDEADTVSGNDVGLQYRFESSNESVACISEDGMIEALGAGEAKVKLIAYPKNNVFHAQNNAAENSILGSYEDSYISTPQNCVVEKQITVKVAGSSQPGDSGDAGNSKDPGNPVDPGNQGGSGQPGNAENEAPKKGDIIEQGSVKYQVSNTGEVTYTKNTKKSQSTVKIPATVKVNGKTYKVTAIADNAFAGNKKLKKVTIGKYVTSIGKNAFKNCSALSTVTIGSNVKKIGANAFYGCKKLKKVTIPKNVTSIGAKAFYRCSQLKTIVVKTTSLKSIGKQAFTGISKKATVKLSVKKAKKAKLKKLFTKKTGFDSKTMKIK